jgi:hypothetical protein
MLIVNLLRVLRMAMSEQRPPPRFETQAPPDIPVRVPQGTYRKPWLKKNGWVLAGLSVVLVLGLFAGLVSALVISGDRKTTLDLRFVEEGPVLITPALLNFGSLKPGLEANRRSFLITNAATEPERIRISLEFEDVAGDMRIVSYELDASDFVLAPGETRMNSLHFIPGANYQSGNRYHPVAHALATPLP